MVTVFCCVEMFRAKVLPACGTVSSEEESMFRAAWTVARPERHVGRIRGCGLSKVDGRVQHIL